MTATGLPEHALGAPLPTLADQLVSRRLQADLPAWVRDAVLVAGGVMLLILGAWAAFELPAVSLGRWYLPSDPYVPVTLQTFGVLFTSAALGARRATVATVIYLAIGIIGLPVFSFGRSGLETFASFDSGRLVLGTTGGYLVGFIAASALVGGLAQRGWDRRLPGSLAAMTLGTLVIYGFGLVWLAAALGAGIVDVLPYGLFPFLPGDLLKLLLAAGLLPLGWRMAGRHASARGGGPRARD
jgi:biotin transport system substrate-specific component